MKKPKRRASGLNNI